ncbi:MAG TPA: hypothetical protein DEA05_14340 [Rhodobacteraceae bacterium]|nr:hypothetical protein [Paracoccaceae bacterium]
MLNRLLLAASVIALAGCAQVSAEWNALVESLHPERQIVAVNGRNWVVAPRETGRDAGPTWVAVRQDDLDPFGRLGQPRTPEAVRALELGSGCRVVPGTLFQTPSADFFADMACPAG